MKKEPKRTLLLFFHSPKHPDSKLVKRQILQDPSFSAYVSGLDHLILFPVSIESFSGWQCTTSSSDRVLTIYIIVVAFQYYIVTVPSFVLVKKGNTTLSVAGRCNGIVDVQSVLMLLRENTIDTTDSASATSNNNIVFSETISEEADDELAVNNIDNIASHSSNISSNVSSTASIKDQTTTLLKQQQSDYEASLAKDRAKEWDRREREANEERMRLLERQYEEERQELVKKAQSLLDANPEPEDGIRLAVQLPDGKKIARRFKPEHPTALLYSFVDVHYLPQPDALTDYRLQSLHPMFHVSRDGTLADHHPHLTDTQHKLYVDLAPAAGMTEEESAGAESDVEDSR